MPGGGPLGYAGPEDHFQPSIIVKTPNDQLAIKTNLSLEIDHSIVGALRLTEDMEGLFARDSIIDSELGLWPDQQSKTVIPKMVIPIVAISSDKDEVPGPKTTLERATVFGRVHIRELELASEVIFNDPVEVIKRQTGCVRFSFVPEESKKKTPHRYRCQPDLALEKKAEEDKEAGRQKESVEDLPAAEMDTVIARVRPEFTSMHYGDPGYAQLSRNTADEVYKGAEDGSEMGVFCSLKQPQREANMTSVLDEYLRFGLEVGLFFVN